MYVHFVCHVDYRRDPEGMCIYIYIHTDTFHEQPNNCHPKNFKPDELKVKQAAAELHGNDRPLDLMDGG